MGPHPLSSAACLAGEPQGDKSPVAGRPHQAEAEPLPAAHAAPLPPPLQQRWPLSKEGVRGCLAFLCQWLPDARPSRAHLKGLLSAATHCRLAAAQAQAHA